MSGIEGRAGIVTYIRYCNLKSVVDSMWNSEPKEGVETMEATSSGVAGQLTGSHDAPVRSNELLWLELSGRR
jgi:hypothetical protein